MFLPSSSVLCEFNHWAEAQGLDSIVSVFFICTPKQNSLVGAVPHISTSMPFSMNISFCFRWLNTGFQSLGLHFYSTLSVAYCTYDIHWKESESLLIHLCSWAQNGNVSLMGYTTGELKHCRCFWGIVYIWLGVHLRMNMKLFHRGAFKSQTIFQGLILHHLKTVLSIWILLFVL